MNIGDSYENPKEGKTYIGIPIALFPDTSDTQSDIVVSCNCRFILCGQSSASGT